jgi:hypothetical protein
MGTRLLRFHFLPQPKGRAGPAFEEWGAVVEGWVDAGRLPRRFGDRQGVPTKGRIVTMQAEPGQLLYQGGCNEKGAFRKWFGLAWRCPDGTLVSQPLAPELAAREIFLAGGHQEPADDTASTLDSIAKVDLMTAPLRGFQELCGITGRYMESHLLVGAPVFTPGTNPYDFAVQTVETLVNHSMAWPPYREVLLAAAERFGEWHRAP